LLQKRLRSLQSRPLLLAAELIILEARNHKKHLAHDQPNPSHSRLSSHTVYGAVILGDASSHLVHNHAAMYVIQLG
jgi:hypothetical protein